MTTPTPAQAAAINEQVKSEMESVLRQFPGLSQATALEIACATVAYLNMTPEEKRRDANRWQQEREEVRASGRKPLWR